MKKNSSITRFLYSLVLVNLIFWQFAGNAQALFGSNKLKIPSASDILNDVEERYGFDPEILRRNQRKGSYPAVEILFDKNEPKIGEKMTATATPTYFKNDTKNLYYTWFLFRKGDDLENEDSMEKAKRRAMGIVARGDFDPFLFGTDYSNSSDDPDKDGYEASFGGDDGVGGRSTNLSSIGDWERDHYTNVPKQLVDASKITRCYRHNFGVSDPEDSDYRDLKYPGDDIIVRCKHRFPEAKQGESFENPYEENGEIITCSNDYEIGDGEFTTNEEACWRLDPENSDTDGDGIKDEADLAGLGQSQLTWVFREGDRLGVVVEGMSLATINEGKRGSGSGSITRTFVDLDGDLSGTAETVTDGGSVSMSGDASVNADGSSSSYSASSLSSDSTSETDFDGVISFDVTEETDADEGATTNPYYKIVWAGMDICDAETVREKDKEDLIEKDECENKDDYGFNYLATRLVYEEGDKLLDSVLTFTPNNPQFSVDNNDYSDYIKVQASFNQSNISDEFVYYKWDIYYCDELEGCTEEFENKLTNCSEGDILGVCGEGIISESYAEGFGLDNIRFKLKDSFLSEKNEYDNFFFKIFLRTKKNKNSIKTGISSVDIPVFVNDNKIRFFKVHKNGDKFDFDESSDEICVDGIYNKICPVYPGQIIAAKADIDIDGSGTSGVEGYLWSLDRTNLSSPRTGGRGDCSFGKGCELDNVVYFPIIGEKKELKTVSLKTKKSNEEELDSERLLSITNPMAKIVSNDRNTATPWVVDDGSEDGLESNKMFLGKKDSTTSFKAQLVPAYLNSNMEENGISLAWHLGGQELTPEFVTNNPEYQILIDGQDISFALMGEEGDPISLKVDVIKTFSGDEKDVLEDNWIVRAVPDLKTEKTITIRQTSRGFDGSVAQSNSVKTFAASTLSNAPEYLVFVLKTAIIFVLLWAFVFGIKYWFEKEITIK